ncbi:TetR/AcrR family transcriptional regulator [Sediminicola sp. 1XM1-17]|uniref:TetR/AcrR family transcriptional regulator n=1 Tax=Sediminicola sp. 1XM1-17 TaxID=3127702 RepID=UPI0030785358
MARKKQYIEQEVLEKAMHLFWRNGYENTSIRMLEKEMGINQFSIYASFGSKQGVFLQSIKAYNKKIQGITDKLEKSQNGVEGIKQYFKDFLEFAKEDDLSKGCMVTNTVNELGKDADPLVMSELKKFADNIKSLFVNNLKQDRNKNAETIERQANFLMNSILGLSVASKMFNDKQLEDSIETVFLNI